MNSYVFPPDNLKQYLVHFIQGDITPAFLCFAEDVPHAIDQAENAYPDATVYAVFECKLAYISQDAARNIT